jgi:creatinine amidohydrolase/Fe(II)-dependent formamide hydrolase-like protein
LPAFDAERRGLTLRKLKPVNVLSVPAIADAQEPRANQARESIMRDHQAAEATYNKTPRRRSLWLTAVFSVFAAVVLALAFSQNTLTAPMPDTVDMADMTWVEVRSAIERGYAVAIVPTGGIEQNGAHMVLGKHDYIVRQAANRIARDLGRTLVTPVVSFVPEGSYDPPSGNMQFPGTLGVPEPVFAQVLEGIARSLKSAGFKTICFIGDHGGNQASQAAVAAKLNGEWTAQATTVLHVADYYVDNAQITYLREKGETPATIGSHAGLIDTSELLAVHPQGVDLSRLAALPLISETPGHSGDPTRASAEYGKALLDIRINAALRQIRAALPDRQVSNQSPQ